MARLRYFLHRLRRLDIANMWRLAGLISAEYRIPTIWIVLDMMQCSVRYYSGYHDYHEWDWHLLRGHERRTYLTRPQAHNLTLTLNDFAHSHDFVDKIAFNRRFAEFIGREWLDVRESTPEQLAAFIRAQSAVVVKPLDALGGAGIEIIDAAGIGDPDELHARLLAGGQVLVETKLVQHPDLARLNPGSVNTLRVITYRRDDEVAVLAQVLKIGNDEPVDNFGRKGMQTTLDEHGFARWGAFDKNGRKYYAHPVTGVGIPGTQVPMWAEVLDMVDRAARVVPEVPYVGWDIAITPTGPAIIEGNYDSGVFQMKPSMSEVRTGLRPHYEAMTGVRIGRPVRRR